MSGIFNSFKTPRATPAPAPQESGPLAHEQALQLKQSKTPKKSAFRMPSGLARLGSAAKSVIQPPVYQRPGETKTRIDWGKLVGRPHDDKTPQDWQQPLMRRDADGKLRMNNTTTGHALAERLNQESTYTDIAMHTDLAAPEGETAEHLSFTMKDKDANYRQVMQTPAMVCVLKSSLAQQQGGDVTTDVRRAGSATLGETTGVFTDRHGAQFCVRGQKLFRFDATRNRWLAHQPEKADIKRLMLDQHGEIYPLRASSTGRDKFYTADYSATLSHSGTEVTVDRFSEGHHQPLHMQTAAGVAFKADQIALLEDGPGSPPRVVATDEHGQLFKSSRLPAPGMNLTTLTMTPVPADDRQHALGDSGTGSRIHGFYHEHGLKAIVEDRHGRYHGLPMDNQRLQPGWILSGQWQAGTRTGLPSAVSAADPKVTLHGGAALALNKDRGELCGWQEMYQDWRPLRTRNVEHLSHGLDNKAYVLQKGRLKPVDAQYEHQKLDLDSQKAVDFGRCTTVSLGAPLTAAEHVKAFAVLDEKKFVTLQVTPAGRTTLTAHLDGKPVTLALPPGMAATGDAAGADAPRLALDHNRNLYLISGNNLQMVPESQWTEPSGSRLEWRAAGLEFHEDSAGGPPRQVDALQDKLLSALQETTAGATVDLRGLTQGRNNRPVLLLSTHGGQDDERVHHLELNRESRTNKMLFKATDEDGPVDQNNQFERSERDNHKTKNQALGRFNAVTATNFFGVSGDDAKVKASAFKQLKETLTHHFHPLRGPQKMVAEAKGAVEQATAHAGAGSHIKLSAQAVLDSLLTRESRAREGLRPLYQESGRLYASLDKLALVPAGRTQTGGDLQSRIDRRIDQTTPQTKALHEEFNQLRKELESSSELFAHRLGLMEGYFDEHGRNAAGKTLNPAYDTKTDMAKLAATMRAGRTAPNPGSKAEEKLHDLAQMGLKLNPRDKRSRGDQGRDSSVSGLVVDRLLLNAQVLQDMHALLDPVDRFNNPRTLEGIRKELHGLRLTLDASPVKLMSDRNFINHKSVENAEETRRAFAQQATGKNALAMHLNQTFGSEDQRVAALTSHFGSMEERDQMSISRSTATTFSSPLVFIGIAPDGGGLSGQLSATSKQQIGVTGAGGKTGTWMGLGKSETQSGALSFGYYHAPSEVIKQFTHGTVGQLYSVDAQLQISRSKASSNLLEIDRHDMAAYLQNLHDYNASLTDLYRLGKSATQEVSTEWAGDVDLSGTVDILRLGVGGSHNPRSGVPRSAVNEFFRITAGLRGNVNVLHAATKSTDSYATDGDSKNVRVNNLKGFSTASVGAYLRPFGHAVNGNVFSDPQPNAQGVNNDVTPAQINMFEVAVGLSLDRTKTNRFNLSFKPGAVVTAKDLQTLEGNIKAHFASQLSDMVRDELPQLLAFRDQQTERNKLAQLLFMASTDNGPDAARTLDTGRLRDLLVPLKRAFPEQQALFTQVDKATPIPAALTRDLQQWFGQLPQKAEIYSARQQILSPMQRLRADDANVATLEIALAQFSRPQARELLAELKQQAPDVMQMQELLNKAIRADQSDGGLKEPSAHLNALQEWVERKLPAPTLAQGWSSSPETEQQVAVRRGMTALVNADKASKDGERQFASAERSHSLPGLGKRKDGLTAEDAPWRETTSAANAEQIARLFKTEPQLRDLARRTEGELPTNVQIIVELKDSVREELEQRWRQSLADSASPSGAAGTAKKTDEMDFSAELKKALSNSDNLRIKRLTTFRPANHTAGIATPSVGLSWSSSASIADGPVLSSFTFEYSKKDESRPIAVGTGGRLLQSGSSQLSRDLMARESGRVVTTSRPGAARTGRHQEGVEQPGTSGFVPDGPSTGTDPNRAGPPII
ncbi:hypothetical protein BFW87_24065 [Pseudomonas fluorescens]|uniref:AvrE-family type 3 secretion system effector n=1 Tax=Pseudomonas fluorescens TaxID=294 RepID=A0A1T2Y654_PSEFL|nr:AvrE-family type 3 secretion system effector [Pseudomonas fluorescens]OPA87516.1 hypothetical protein BFW87_24065 [Pseudomonas fluorescens]